MSQSDPWKKPALGAKARSEPPPVVRVPPSVQFRGEIEAAVRDGLDPSDLTLHLTLRNADSLKRDRNLADADIGYVDGQMRFLGVLVVVGDANRLERPTPASAG